MGNGVFDNSVRVYAENSFNNPLDSFNYSLYYFEIKCVFKRELDSGKTWMVIGLENLSTNNWIRFVAFNGTIINEKSFKVSTSFNDNDIYGCGLVFPPINKMNEEFPYVFFTQNGKQIGKATLLKNNFDTYETFVWLQCCSVEANFGSNLETKPFKYDISNHSIIKEFY
ncbi:unnamed protein product [Meloidogyne enterolobii]|uniref:Uncharacterized protein n=1 Tax=Meloidogyne enterolobii TaxID=390850 RepID=A0ACB0ZBM3_MELEN